MVHWFRIQNISKFIWLKTRVYLLFMLFCILDIQYGLSILSWSILHWNRAENDVDMLKNMRTNLKIIDLKEWSIQMGCSKSVPLTMSELHLIETITLSIHNVKTTFTWDNYPCDSPRYLLVSYPLVILVVDSGHN
jgi:hypothetical protein